MNATAQAEIDRLWIHRGPVYLRYLEAKGRDMTEAKAIQVELNRIDQQLRELERRP